MHARSRSPPFPAPPIFPPDRRETLWVFHKETIDREVFIGYTYDISQAVGAVGSPAEESKTEGGTK